MLITNAKCTNCGTIVKVDSSKDADICPVCHSAFVVEKAIRYYRSTSGTSSHNNVTNASCTAGDIITKAAIAKQFERCAIQYGCWYLYLKSDGMLGICTINEQVVNIPPEIDYHIFAWTNIKKFFYVPRIHDGKETIAEDQIIALTYDGRILVSDRMEMGKPIAENRLRSALPDTQIADLCYSLWNNGVIVVLTESGSVITIPDMVAGQSVHDIARIIPTDMGDYTGGPILAVSRVDGYTTVLKCEKKFIQHEIEKWTDIIQWAGGGDVLYGLRRDGVILKADFEGTKEIANHVISIKEGIVIYEDGSLSDLKKTYHDRTVSGKGYIQSMGSEFFLTEEGRVDKQGNRGIFEDVLAMVHHNSRFANHMVYVDPNGYLVAENKPRVRIFVGDAVDYGKKKSAHIQDDTTIKHLTNKLKSLYDSLEQKHTSSFFRNLEYKKAIRQEIAAYEAFLNHVKRIQ